MTTAITPNAKNHTGLGPLASRAVKVEELPWEKTRFPGVETKTLLVDPKSGLLTVLMRMAPGATLPDHEHVLIEQTYVLEGRLVDKVGPDEGLSVGPGEFVWRPAGSRHVAWAPEGGLMIAIFNVPNKFFDQPEAVSDLLGRDWEKTWGKVGA
jgi:quercetin dioxygenase-like cupin family protein